MRHLFSVVFTLMVPSSALAAYPSGSLDRQIDVIRYSLTLRPDIKSTSLSGKEVVEFVAKAGARDILFSKNDLTIDKASIDGKPIDYHQIGENIAFSLPELPRSKRASTLLVTFHGTPKRGLVAQPQVLYASYFGCDWMFCMQNTPGDKAWFDLNLYLPTGISSLGVGHEVQPKALANGLTLHSWRSDQPYSSYLFGFAAGTFKSTVRRHGDTQFTFLDAAGADDDINKLAADTFEIADFLAAKAGIPISGRHYTQLLVAGDEAQEEGTFSLIAKDVLDDDLRQPESQWVVVHEMSHQWWGNLITCETWQDFWLNEGFATFMTAAWKQHRFGESAYQAELDVARRRVKRAGELGFDKPLAWGGKYPSLGLRRAIQYSKGALFLDHLRTELGEDSFWKGIRLYTRRYAGKSVTSHDFEAAMAEASGRDLSPIFREWVYGPPSEADR